MWWSRTNACAGLLLSDARDNPRSAFGSRVARCLSVPSQGTTKKMACVRLGELGHMGRPNLVIDADSSLSGHEMLRDQNTFMEKDQNTSMEKDHQSSGAPLRRVLFEKTSVGCGAPSSLVCGQRCYVCVACPCNRLCVWSHAENCCCLAAANGCKQHRAPSPRMRVSLTAFHRAWG